MIKLFYDSEFTGLQQKTTLISIGFITENNDTFYAEFDDYDRTQIDEWLSENIIQKLKYNEDTPFIEVSLDENDNNVTIMKGNSKEIVREFENWLYNIAGVTPEEVTDPLFEVWSDCLSYDWVLFNQMWDHAFNIPKIVYYIPFDICTGFKIFDIDPDVSREAFAEITEDIDKHNSLWDAKVIKACYEKIERIR